MHKLTLGSLILGLHRASQTKMKAIQDPHSGKAGQDVWFLIKPPAEHPPRRKAGFLLIYAIGLVHSRRKHVLQQCF